MRSTTKLGHDRNAGTSYADRKEGDRRLRIAATQADAASLHAVGQAWMAGVPAIEVAMLTIFVPIGNHAFSGTGFLLGIVGLQYGQRPWTFSNNEYLCLSIL